MLYRLNYQGLTLIELLLAVAVIAILATLGIPSLNGWIKENNISETTNQILQNFYYAREKSIISGFRYKVELYNSDTGIKANIYTEEIISSSFDCNGTFALDSLMSDEIDLIGNQNIKMLNCTSENSCNENLLKVCFFSHGGATETFIQVLDNNNQNIKKKIKIYGATGFIEVYNWKENDWVIIN